jgi:4-amino-4-deoxy-L-arabinose transferase-like glycosyltransferase
VTIVRPEPFRTRLALVALLGLSLRLAYIAKTAISGDRVGGDGRYYHAIAGFLADGKGFIDPTPYMLHGQAVPSAPHPPVWPLMLSAPALVGLRGFHEQQLFACLIGTATVVMIGLAGRELAGHTVGLIAAVIAALSPNFWLYERELMSETVTLLGTATTLFLAYRFVAQPSRGRAVAVGLACGLLAITHSETLLLIGLLLVPLVLRAREVPRRRRLGWALLATAAAIVVVVPWVAYNTARFHEPVFLGTEFGVTVAVSNCDFTYSGDHIGFQDRRCSDAATRTGRLTAALDTPAADRQYLSVGLDYARAHLSRVPVVIAAREGRAWSLFRPFAQMRLDHGRGTRLAVLQLGLLTYWLLLLPAVAGAVILRRRGTPVFPLLAFPVIVMVAVAVTYGFTRFRASAEVPIALLAAVAIDAAVRRTRSGRRSLIEHNTSRTTHDPTALDA